MCVSVWVCVEGRVEGDRVRVNVHVCARVGVGE